MKVYTEEGLEMKVYTDFYMMSGEGFYEDFRKCTERNITRVVDNPRISKIDYSYLSQITKGNLVLGGGNGFEQMKSLINQKQNLKKFIKNGGNAIGICAGAYYLSPIFGSDFVGAECDLKTMSKENQKLKIRKFLISIEDKESSFDVPYWGGPEFIPGIKKYTIEEDVVARFEDTNQAAVLVGSYGDGKLLLTSPHLELDTEFPFKKYEEHFHHDLKNVNVKEIIQDNQESMDSLTKLFLSKLNISTK